jgi:formate/nitrite transporter
MDRLFLTPVENFKNLVTVGKGKCALPLDKMFILGILAGMYIGAGAGICTMLVHDPVLAKTLGVGFVKFMGGAVFTVGLMLVIIAGSELFTGNCLITIGMLNGDIPVGDMIKNWVVVYLGNMVGSIFMAFIYWQSGLWTTNGGLLGASAVNIAAGKCALPFMEAFWRGVGCNWLVCLAVVLALASKSIVGKVWAIFFPIMTFVCLGYEHSVANMYFIPAGIFAKGMEACAKHCDAAKMAATNWNTFFVVNLVPVTLGNIVGGAILVGAVYWYIYVKDAK